MSTTHHERPHVSESHSKTRKQNSTVALFVSLCNSSATSLQNKRLDGCMSTTQSSGKLLSEGRIQKTPKKQAQTRHGHMSCSCADLPGLANEHHRGQQSGSHRIATRSTGYMKRMRRSNISQHVQVTGLGTHCFVAKDDVEHFGDI